MRFSITRIVSRLLVGVALSALSGGCGSGTPQSSASSETTAVPAAGGESGAAPAAVASALTAAAAKAPEVPPAPRFREVVIPSGMPLRLRLTSAVASDTSQAEDPVRATVDSPVMVGGETAIPDGAAVSGSVVTAARSGKVKGLASLVIAFDQVSAWDDRYDVRTQRITRVARATKGKDAQKIGIGAGAGALIGAIAGGGKGAAIGSAVGAGAGSGAVAATRGDEVRLPAGTTLTTKLAAPLTVRVPVP